MKKKEILLLCLFIFAAVSIVIPTQSYAISLDDDDEDREDVGDYLQSAKSAAKNENFSQAQSLLKKAKSHGVLLDDVKEVQNYIVQKKQAYEDRLERERQAKLERERQERERIARLERERESSRYSSSGFRGFHKNDCYKIREHGPQQVCLNGTGGNSCYSIRNHGLQQVCLNGAGGNSCYALKGYASQQVCLKGIRTDACYGFSNNYNRQKSCRNFSGSTEFWLIFSSYGYYTWK